MGRIRIDTQSSWFKVGPIWDAELRVWDAKNFGPVSSETHRNKFVKKSLLIYTNPGHLCWIANGIPALSDPYQLNGYILKVVISNFIQI